MITAWVLHYNGLHDTFHFEELNGVNYDSVQPDDWSLGEHHEIILVLQKASFIGVWLDGERLGR